MNPIRRVRLGLYTLAAVAVLALPVFAAQSEMVTFCHAAGQEGTLKYVTLTLPYNAVFGQAGHFNEDGTPAAGHEADYLGACIPPTTTTTTTTTTTSTTSSTTSTTSSTTSTTGPTTTTTVPPPPTPSTTIPGVLPTTIPTIPPITPPIDELPYTGIDAVLGTIIGLSSLTTGALTLRLTRRH